MEKPKISVIIPVHNGERTLRLCLESVMNQGYKNYEIIIVDNNSDDRTKNIIDEFRKKDVLVKYVFEKKIGRGNARNSGIRLAKGEIIVMTDSDCVVPKDWIEELIKPIIYDNESCTVGSEDDLFKNYWTKRIQKENLAFIELNLAHGYLKHIDTKNFAIKTSLMKKFMFDPGLISCEDFEFYLRIKNYVKVKFISSLRVGHYGANSFKKFVKNNFERAYWVKKIYDKHKNYINLKDETMTRGISVKNFILFPLWTGFQFFKKPLGEAYFVLISELSWRAGIIYSIIA